MELNVVRLRSRSSLRLTLRKEPLLQHTLQASRERIKKGTRYSAIHIEPRPWHVSEPTTVIRVARHKKTRSETWEVGGNLRERSVGRDLRFNKPYLIPPKPLLLPFAERPADPTSSYLRLRESQRLLPKGFLSLFQSSHPSPSVSQLHTDRIQRTSSIVQVDI